MLRADSKFPKGLASVMKKSYFLKEERASSEKKKKKSVVRKKISSMGSQGLVTTSACQGATGAGLSWIGITASHFTGLWNWPLTCDNGPSTEMQHRKHEAKSSASVSSWITFVVSLRPTESSQILREIHWGPGSHAALWECWPKTPAAAPISSKQ